MDGSRTIELRQRPLDPLEVLARWHGQWSGDGAGTGGTLRPPAEAHFIGRVRGTSAGGEPLQALEPEHDPGMGEARLHRLAGDCARRHGVAAVLVFHRMGRILPGEAIVLVAVAADRRGQAQRCSQELLEALKHEAPCRNREWSAGAGSWVPGNTAW
ncbi:MAG: molybdopterin synthase catalytic subunit [Cyanobium sp.]